MVKTVNLWLCSGIILLSLLYQGCAGCPYSFSGASVPVHMKKIAIPFTDDKSGTAEPGLRQKFTDKLTRKFIDDNSLKISEKASADAILETVILGIQDAPSVVIAGESVTQRKLSITVQAVFKDFVKKKTVYEKQFSNFATYAASEGRIGRDKALETAIDKVTDDILLETVSGW